MIAAGIDTPCAGSVAPGNGGLTDQLQALANDAELLGVNLPTSRSIRSSAFSARSPGRSPATRTPKSSGLEAVIRISSFNVTVDYLVIDDAERRLLNAPSSHLDARVADLDQLTDEERATITNVIDAPVTKAKLRLITGGAG